jgi:hypothetical protein
MQSGLQAVDLEAFGRFSDGEYRRVFPSVAQGYGQKGEVADWARAYIVNQDVLEYGAREAYAVPTRTGYDAQHTALGMAARHAGLSRAGVCTGIIPTFEDFMERRFPGQMPLLAQLAKTDSEVALMERAMDLTSNMRFQSIAVLRRSANVDEFLFYALTSVLFPQIDTDAWLTVREDVDSYQSAVFEWFGESRESMLMALKLADVNVPLDDVKKFGEAGIELEYALTLVDSPSA